ncbi:MAG TPA: antibiotic biosynthesis monooxygenase [Thermomicrobiaceae bacterium]|nr:antibiotic biosynthesis monooxygenase [Thermomicrobiaceae bacterium]
MYVAANTLRVPADRAARIEQGFAHAGGRMQQIPGCVSFTLLKEESTTDEAVYVAMTHWQDEAAFRAWAASDAFRQAHAGAGESGASGEVHLYTVVV